jgi:hypothetical protein
LEKRDSRVVVMEVRRAWICDGRAPGVIVGGAFSLSVEGKESRLFWLDASSFLDCVGGDDGIWEDGCEEGGPGIGNSSCTI